MSGISERIARGASVTPAWIEREALTQREPKRPRGNFGPLGCSRLHAQSIGSRASWYRGFRRDSQSASLVGSVGATPAHDPTGGRIQAMRASRSAE